MNNPIIRFATVIANDDTGDCDTKSNIGVGMRVDIRIAKAIFDNKKLFNRFKRQLKKVKLKTRTQLAFQYDMDDPLSLGRLKLTSFGAQSESEARKAYVQSFIEEIRFEALKVMYSQRTFELDRPLQPNFVPIEVGEDAKDISEGMRIVFSINREKKNSTSL